MSRDIKFRGLRVDGKGWVYGSYATDGKHYHAIIKESELDESEMLNIPIKPESLGQYTGLIYIDNLADAFVEMYEMLEGVYKNFELGDRFEKEIESVLKRARGE